MVDYNIQRVVHVMKKFSFIIPVYNVPINLLDRGINALLSYKGNDIEVIIIDDGSTNDVAARCDYYLLDDRVIVFHQKNQGVSVARNVGIKNAKGDYIIFVDPDDYILDSIFSDFIKDDMSDVFIFDFVRELSNGEKMKVYIGDRITKINSMEMIKNTLFCDNKYGKYLGGAVWAKAFKRKFLLDNNIVFDEKLRKAQDRVFMLDVYKLAHMVTYINICAYVYYENIESICNKFNPGCAERNKMFLYAVKMKIKEMNLDVYTKQQMISKAFFLSYFEILYLDLFNIENEQTYFRRRMKAKQEYMNMDMREMLENLSLKQCASLSEKLKLFLIKNRCFFLLNVLIRTRQARRLKN